jgi:hypothetical protein
MLSTKDSYKKIRDTENATPSELMRDLRKRSRYYHIQSRKLAKRNIRASLVLKIFSFSLSAFIGFTLILFQNNILNNISVIWATASCSFIVSIMSIMQVFLFDDTVSAKLLFASEQFFDIKEQIKMFEAENSYKKFDNDIILDKYRILYDLYKDRHDKFVEHVITSEGYYGVRVINKIIDPKKIPVSLLSDKDI